MTGSTSLDGRALPCHTVLVATTTSPARASATGTQTMTTFMALTALLPGSQNAVTPPSTAIDSAVVQVDSSDSR